MCVIIVMIEVSRWSCILNVLVEMSDVDDLFENVREVLLALRQNDSASALRSLFLIYDISKLL